jgi:hypothetical protein
VSAPGFPTWGFSEPNYPADATNIEADPLFVDAAAADFHLQHSSPCMDVGNPDSAYNDPDGSRNDPGAYGGPNGSW